MILGLFIGYLISSLLGFDLNFLNRHPVIYIIAVILFGFLPAEFSIRMIEPYVQTEYTILGKSIYLFTFGSINGFALPVILDAIQA